jgi:hypothetical protein
MNAWEEGNRIIADVMQFEEAPLFTHPDGLEDRSGEITRAYCRWTFDLAGNTDRFTQTYLDDLTGEFPRIDDRRAGQANSHGWYACANPILPMFGALSGIVHVDGKGKRLGHYLLPAGDTISEPVFVERGRDAAEGDGWLVSAVWRAQENRSDLAVFNAQDVESGPVALVHLGHRVPDGFHGNWVGAGVNQNTVISGASRSDELRCASAHRESGDCKLEIPGSRWRAPRNDVVDRCKPPQETAMHLPSITSAYLAVLALLYTILAGAGRAAAHERPCGVRRQRKPRAAQRDPRARQLHRIRADHYADGRDARNVRRRSRLGPSVDGRAAGVRGSCIRSACTPRPIRCNFASAGWAGSPSRTSY